MGMDWISICDIIPDNEVIAFGYQGNIIIGLVFDDGGNIVCESESERLDDITHWMPLPEPPQTVKE